MRESEKMEREFLVGDGVRVENWGEAENKNWYYNGGFDIYT